MHAASHAVVGLAAEPRLVHTDRSLAHLLLAEEVELVGGDDDGGGGRRYRGGVTSRLPLLAAAALTVTGELEVLLGSAPDSERLVSALALPVLTVPLAWSRRAPLPALMVVALALAVQAVSYTHLTLPTILLV